MDKEKLLCYATQAVPRYTSYPTAADFVSVTDSTRIGWLRAVRPGQPVSLYLHVPYCSELCHYCGCFTKVARRRDVVESYADVMAEDIRLQGSCLAERPRVIHLHWGGGTPSMLSPAGFGRIMAALHKAFFLDPAAEHAIELDPRTVNDGLAVFLASLGVNRASLGVQDINPAVQKVIGRIQPAAVVERAVSCLRRAGITRISFDLIYGLPLQTRESLRETCATVAAMEPDRIACYGYAHLPARRANQRLIDSALLPGAFERFMQAEAVADSFRQFGYQAIGIDHFARPDDPMTVAMHEKRLHRNFQGYTDDDSSVLIGFGASSISEFPQGYAQTVADIGQYRHAIGEGRLATARGIVADEDDRRRAMLIRELMCRFEVDLARYGGRDLFAPELARLEPVIADGLAREVGGVISIEEAGRPFVRVVAALFDTYRHRNVGRFSAAV